MKKIYFLVLLFWIGSITHVKAQTSVEIMNAYDSALSNCSTPADVWIIVDILTTGYDIDKDSIITRCAFVKKV